MLLSKSTLEHSSWGLDRLVKQRRDVFLLVSVCRTEDHHSILQETQEESLQTNQVFQLKFILFF